LAFRLAKRLRHLRRWASTLFSGFPPDDLSPKTLSTLQMVFMGICALATAAFIVALVVLLV
jgi:hypothetical protein